MSGNVGSVSDTCTDDLDAVPQTALRIWARCGRRLRGGCPTTGPSLPGVLAVWYWRRTPTTGALGFRIVLASHRVAAAEQPVAADGPARPRLNRKRYLPPPPRGRRAQPPSPLERTRRRKTSLVASVAQAPPRPLNGVRYLQYALWRAQWIMNRPRIARTISSGCLRQNLGADGRTKTDRGTTVPRFAAV